MIKNETQLMTYIKKHHNTIFPSFRSVEFNYQVIGWASKKRIGEVDFLFKKRSRTFVVEVKYNTKLCEAQTFWESLKVLGYVEAMKLGLGAGQRRVSPVILVHKSILTADKMAIVGKLGLKYITFEMVEQVPMFEYFLL